MRMLVWVGIACAGASASLAAAGGDPGTRIVGGLGEGTVTTPSGSCAMQFLVALTTTNARPGEGRLSITVVKTTPVPCATPSGGACHLMRGSWDSGWEDGDPGAVTVAVGAYGTGEDIPFFWIQERIQDVGTFDDDLRFRHQAETPPCWPR